MSRDAAFEHVRASLTRIVAITSATPAMDVPRAFGEALALIQQHAESAERALSRAIERAHGITAPKAKGGE